MSDPCDLEQRIERELEAGADADSPARRLLAELYECYRDQRRLLDRLVHISDQYQRAERERGQAFAADYRREVRRIEKLVRISDSYQTMLRDLNDRLHTLSTRDDLTGLLNRRSLRLRLQEEMTAVNRGGPDLALALADIDHFKRINDSWGHLAGDAVLVRIAGILGERPCGRWGGEEFLILFPGHRHAEAIAAAEQLRAAVAALRHPGPDGRPFSATISLGLTPYHPGETLEQTLARADDALYRAKDAGRDRTLFLA